MKKIFIIITRNFRIYNNKINASLILYISDIDI